MSAPDHSEATRHIVRSLDTDQAGRDAIDRGEPWPEFNPPARRKDSEVKRVLSLLDELSGERTLP